MQVDIFKMRYLGNKKRYQTAAGSKMTPTSMKEFSQVDKQTTLPLIFTQTAAI